MRRVICHIILFAASGLTCAVFYYGLGFKRPMASLSMATAYGGLALMALSLIIGPWNTLRGHRIPTSSYLRRDVGIWAGILSIAHVIFGLQVHFTGKMWLYFLPPVDAAYSFPIRIDAFGLSNHMGLAATLIVLLLLSLSNNPSLRALGAIRWKSLQRWNYVGAVLVAAHGVIYQINEKRTAWFVVVFASLLLLTSAMQYAGYRKVKQHAS